MLTLSLSLRGVNISSEMRVSNVPACYIMQTKSLITMLQGSSQDHGTSCSGDFRLPAAQFRASNFNKQKLISGKSPSVTVPEGHDASCILPSRGYKAMYLRERSLRQ